MADSSFTRQVADIGTNEFSQDLDHLLPGSELITTECIQHEVVSAHGGQYLVDGMTRWTCLHKDDVTAEEDCIDLIVGNLNPSNVILASQNNGRHTQTARLPVLRYNPDAQMVYRAPSSSQINYAGLVEDERLRQLGAEKKSQKNRVKKFKKMLRNA